MPFQGYFWKITCHCHLHFVHGNIFWTIFQNTKWCSHMGSFHELALRALWTAHRFVPEATNTLNFTCILSLSTVGSKANLLVFEQKKLSVNQSLAGATFHFSCLFHNEQQNKWREVEHCWVHVVVQVIET